jgi:hypothetical protein
VGATHFLSPLSSTLPSELILLAWLATKLLVVQISTLPQPQKQLSPSVPDTLLNLRHALGLFPDAVQGAKR